MSEKKKWGQRKVNLSSAIALGGLIAIAVAIAVFNWGYIFGGGLLNGSVVSKIDWSSLDVIYEKLANTYNGEIDVKALIEGAKYGMVQSLGDDYTVLVLV